MEDQGSRDSDRPGRNPKGTEAYTSETNKYEVLKNQPNDRLTKEKTTKTIIIKRVENELNQGYREEGQITTKTRIEYNSEQTEPTEGGPRQRRKIKIVEEKVTKPTVTLTERRKIKVEADKPNQPVGTLRDRYTKPKAVLNVRKFTETETNITNIDITIIKERITDYWIYKCRATSAESLQFINRNKTKPDTTAKNKLTEEYEYRITHLETTIIEKDEE